MNVEKEHSKRLSEALDLCIDRINRGATVEDCLASYPDLSDELRPLLLTVQSLRSTARLQPRPEAKAAGRGKLEAAMRARSQAPSTGWRLPSFIEPMKGWVAMASIMVLFLGGFGVVQASSGSAPGDLLYSVKRTVERGQLAWPLQSDEAKARLSERLAARRSDEIVKLIERGKTAKLVELTARVEKNLDRATRLRLDNGDADLQKRLDKLTDLENERQTAAAEEGPALDASPDGIRAPDSARDREIVAQRATKVAKAREKNAERIESARDDVLELSAKQAKHLQDAKAKLERDFKEQKAKIASALEKASPQARARVQSALADRRSNYESALKQIDEQLQRVSETRSKIQQQGTPKQEPREDREGRGDPQGRSPTGDDREKPDTQGLQRPDAARPGRVGERITATPEPVNRPDVGTGPGSRVQPNRERQAQNEGPRIIADGPEPTEVTPTPRPRRRGRQPSSQVPLDPRSALEEVAGADRSENEQRGLGQSRPGVDHGNSEVAGAEAAEASEANNTTSASEDADGRNSEDEPKVRSRSAGTVQ